MAVEYWGLVDENSIFRGVNLKSCGGGRSLKKFIEGICLVGILQHIYGIVFILSLQKN